MHHQAGASKQGMAYSKGQLTAETEPQTIPGVAAGEVTFIKAHFFSLQGHSLIVPNSCC